MAKILIIKLSALGDMILATSAFKAIRNHHLNDHLTLLTTPPYVGLVQKMKLFDEIVCDNRPKFYNPLKLFKLRNFLRNTDFKRVYDLQLVDRTNGYFYLLGNKRKKIEWVGTAKKASHPYHDPKMLQTYVQDRFRALLKPAGITDIPSLDVRLLGGNIESFSLPEKYALIVPGASNAHGGKKRWPLDWYARLADYIFKHYKVTPVVIGGAGEDNTLIKQVCSQCIDLTGKTSIEDIIGLAEKAQFAIGNDTGPMQIAGACQIPVVTLFSGLHNPAVVGPRGSRYLHIQEDNLQNLCVEEVAAKLDLFLLSF